MLVVTEDPALNQQLQFTLHRSNAAAGATHNLAKIKGLVRPQKSKIENCLSRATEKHIAGF